ncbi:hypothetical protein FTO74_01275 [Granulicella sp. WH15]|uniref:hypothetical protein n=1 Tax=Granulicella sp. WH15 TaxID=2602070 RepID=UPI00136746CC|nr:hypothetical protein [Granulicella sp. WH15]QHN02162.1 hypothetical protein FTO74_01275 [Granulicella sp. WH15]
MFSAIFLWSNIVIFGYLSISSWRTSGGQEKIWSLGQGFQHPSTWQAITSLVVLLTHVSPWNLVWTFVLFSIIGYVREKRKIPPALIALSRELPPEDQKDFIEFGLSHPALRQAFTREFVEVLRSPSGEYRKLQTSLALNWQSENFKDVGNLFETLQCLRWALKFEPLNRNTWYALSEAHFTLSDRCAARWAKKYLTWSPDSSTPQLMKNLYSPGSEIMHGEHFEVVTKRLTEIIDICEQNDHWSDSAELRMPFGLLD